MDEEGRVEYEQETKDVRPYVHRQGKRVARSSTPLSPSAPPVRTFTGKRKLPEGDEGEGEIEAGEDSSRSHATVLRAYRNKDDYNERLLLQDSKREQDVQRFQSNKRRKTGVIDSVLRTLGVR